MKAEVYQAQLSVWTRFFNYITLFYPSFPLLAGYPILIDEEFESRLGDWPLSAQLAGSGAANHMTPIFLVDPASDSDPSPNRGLVGQRPCPQEQTALEFLDPDPPDSAGRSVKHSANERSG